MPRKAPKEVIEHRISLSNFERSLIKDVIEKRDLGMKEKRENALYVAGINQIGAIAGSSLLLYGLGLYLGLNLVKDAKDAITDFVDDSSTNLADLVTDVFGNGVIRSTEESKAIVSFYDRIDEAKKSHRSQERLNSIAINAVAQQLMANEITMTQAQSELQLLDAQGDELDQLRVDILNAYAHGRYIHKTGAPIPNWMGLENWPDVVAAGKDWDGPNSSQTNELS